MKKADNKKILIILFVFILICPSILEAAISGIVDYTYSSFTIKDSANSISHSQTYSINKNGAVLNRKIGSYTIGFGYSNIKSTSVSKSEDDEDLYTAPSENSSDMYNYSISSSLFPSTFSPFTFSFSKYTTSQDTSLNPKTKGTAFLSETETNTYRGTWRLISKRKLPTMHSSFGLVNTISKSEFNPHNDSKRNFKVDLNKGGLRTMYRLNYNYEDYSDVGSGDYSKTQSISANLNRLISRKTTLNISAGFSKSTASENFNLLGNVFARHSQKIDSTYSYGFTLSTPAGAERSYVNKLDVNTRYSPTSKLRGHVRYSFSNLLPNAVNTNVLGIGTSYRMTEFWNAHTATSTTRARGTDFDSFTNSFSAGSDYSIPFKHAKLNSSYSFGYSIRESDRPIRRTTTIESVSESEKEAKISIHPNHFNFWNTNKGSSSVPEVITITNRADTPSKDKSLTISSIIIDDIANFSIDLFAGDEPCGNTSKVLGEGESCTFTVTFTPTVENGEIVDTNVTILSSDSQAPSLLLDCSGGEDKMSSKKISAKTKTNSISIGLSSTTLKKIGLSLSNRFSRTDSTSDNVKTGSEGLASTLGIRTSFWKHLSLSNTTTYSNTLNNERSQQLSTNFTYSITIPFLENMVIASGYSYTTNLSGEATSQTNNSYSISTSYSKNLLRSLRFSVGLRRSWNGIPGGNTSSVNEISPRITYKVGMLTFSIENNLNEAKTSGAVTSYTLNYDLNLKVSRRF